MKRILVLGAGYYYRRVLKQLRDARFHVLAVDRDPHAPGREFVHKFASIDIVDQESVLAFAKGNRIDGILPINDFGTRAAAYVSEQMSLPGISRRTADLANDKGWMRDTWRKAQLPIPDYRIVGSLDALRHFAKEIGFPCVLKPTDCGGSGRGVSVLESEGDVDWSYEFARPYAPNGRFILEQFLDGLELTVETISFEERVIVLAMSDKYKPNLRTRVATSLNFPADIPPMRRREVETLVQRAVEAIGIRTGMAHTEVIVTQQGPRLVELGARGGGGHVFHTIIEAVSGVKAPLMAARVAVGEVVEVPAIQQRGAVYRFFNPPPGILKRVENLDEARRIPGVMDIDIIKQPGERIWPLENSLHRVGFVVTSGDNRADAVRVADHIESLVQFTVEETSDRDRLALTRRDGPRGC